MLFSTTFNFYSDKMIIPQARFCWTLAVPFVHPIITVLADLFINTLSEPLVLSLLPKCECHILYLKICTIMIVCVELISESNRVWLTFDCNLVQARMLF